MSVLNRVDVTPSGDWSAIPISGRLVWAALDGDKIATYWEVPSNPEPGSGWTLIRTDQLPFDSDVIGGPPPYRAHWAGIDGAVAFINDEVFLWTVEVPLAGPPFTLPPVVGVEGHALNIALYPKNETLAPPED